jgi:hypothetical protein
LEGLELLDGRGMWIAEGFKTGDEFREDGGERQVGGMVVVAEQDDYITIDRALVYVCAFHRHGDL